MAIRYNKEELRRCGYRIESQFAFFDASDDLQAFERAHQAAKEGKWLIVGPRRSHQYLVLAKGAEGTPTVSTMASSAEVFSLGGIHSTMAPSNAEMVAVAVGIAKKESSTYFSVVDSDCLSCRDFSKEFDRAASGVGLKKLGETQLTGDGPDFNGLRQQVRNLRPGVVLLPNYSKQSSRVMFELESLESPPLFLGSDGWGDSHFGFLSAGIAPGRAKGITVRGFPPSDVGLKTFSVGRRILKDRALIGGFPDSGSSQSLIRIVSGLTEALCKHRPDRKERFTAMIREIRPFKPYQGVSVYKLERSRISFERIEKASVSR